MTYGMDRTFCFKGASVLLGSKRMGDAMRYWRSTEARTMIGGDGMRVNPDAIPLNLPDRAFYILLHSP
jgi:hypothetical protein